MVASVITPIPSFVVGAAFDTTGAQTLTRLGRAYLMQRSVAPSCAVARNAGTRSPPMRRWLVTLRSVFAFGLTSVFVVAGCSLFDAPEAPGFVSDGTPCGNSCANIFSCFGPNQDQAAFAACHVECRALEDNTLVSCTANAACENLGDCLATGSMEQCALAMGRSVECGAPSASAGCSRPCTRGPRCSRSATRSR